MQPFLNMLFMLYLICAHLLRCGRINMSFNSVLMCISQPCLRPYCVTTVSLRAHPHVRCAKVIWNGGQKAISAARGANINMTSHISAHHLWPRLGWKDEEEKWGFAAVSAITPILKSDRGSMSPSSRCGQEGQNADNEPG